MDIIKVYGIPNCDTIKKTLDWFKAKKVTVEFHNYKTDGITKQQLTGWSKQVGWQTLLNKKGTTFKKLLPQEQEKINSQATAIQWMTENTSSIKRPVVEYGGRIIVGFDENAFITQLK